MFLCVRDHSNNIQAVTLGSVYVSFYCLDVNEHVKYIKYERRDSFYLINLAFFPLTSCWCYFQNSLIWNVSRIFFLLEKCQPSDDWFSSSIKMLLIWSHVLDVERAASFYCHDNSKSNLSYLTDFK